MKGIGILGTNSVNNQVGYSPPKSQGPGPKTYIYTIYALSAPPKITVSTSQVSRDVLLSAIKDLTLDSAELSVVYTRSDQANDNQSDAQNVELKLINEGNFEMGDHQSKGQIVNFIYNHGKVIRKEFKDSLIHIHAKIDRRYAEKLEKLME